MPPGVVCRSALWLPQGAGEVGEGGCHTFLQLEEWCVMCTWMVGQGQWKEVKEAEVEEEAEGRVKGVGRLLRARQEQGVDGEWD